MDASPLPVTSPEAMLQIQAGCCHILVAFDCGLSIDLDECERRITALKQRATMRHRRRAPSHFQYRPLPLRVSIPCDSVPILPGHDTLPQVDITLWDFGAALVSYTIPLSGTVDRLAPLSDALYDHPVILTQARWRLQQLLATVQDAVASPALTDFHEDYLIFEISAWDLPEQPITEWCERNRDLIARILRSESQPLSDESIREALRCQLTFSPEDLSYIDWNASLILDPQADDLIAVLEFANVELLELRWLDQKLDDALDAAYTTLVRRRLRRNLRWTLTARDPDLDRVAQLQVDGAVLFEGVNNALKLIGDQYLARAYQLAAERFHLGDWDAAILRKLSVLDNIHSKLSERRATQRMEILEWIIILLILISILIPYIPGLKY
jgi:hypothetical protein